MLPYRFSFLQPGDDDPSAVKPFNVNFANVDPSEDDSSASPMAAAPSGPGQGSPPGQSAAPDFMSAYRDLLSGSKGPAMMAYEKFLSNGYPDEKNYKPSIGTRIGAILSGVGAGINNPAIGGEVAKRILDDPYQKALDKYKAEGGRLEKGAALEENEQQKKINTLNSVRDMEYKMGQLDRQNRLTDSQIELNVARANAAGLKILKNETDGHYYSVTPDGTKTDLGSYDKTFDQKQQAAIEKQYKITKLTSPIIQGREIAVGKAAAENAQALEDTRETNRESLEAIKAQNRTMLQDQKGQQQLERDMQRAKITGNHLQVAARIRDNRDQTEALVKSDPNKYGKYWVLNQQTGYKELTDPPDMNKDPQGYNDYVTIYNQLYKGTDKQLSPQGAAKTTPNGNQIVRNKK